MTRKILLASLLLASSCSLFGMMEHAMTQTIAPSIKGKAGWQRCAFYKNSMRRSLPISIPYTEEAILPDTHVGSPPSVAIAYAALWRKFGSI